MFNLDKPPHTFEHTVYNNYYYYYYYYYYYTLGIPPAYRGNLWISITLSNRKQNHYPKDYYNNLLTSLSLLDEKVKCEIEKDIRR